jgi:Ribosomal subunit 39S
LIEVFLCKSTNIDIASLESVSPEELQGIVAFGTVSEAEGAEPRPVAIFASESDRDHFWKRFAFDADASTQIPDMLKLESDISSASAIKHYKTLPISSPELRFALLKRILQRTGRRVADCDLDQCTTAGSVLRVVQKPQKPPKLASVIAQQQQLALPNVKTFARRQNAINKDIGEGRWKIIREELAKRALPEFKHRDIRERDLPTDLKKTKYQ